ncbi:MAG: hypothetical protein ACI9XZ_003981 [Alphaproteobacteria bacterium]
MGQANGKQEIAEVFNKAATVELADYVQYRLILNERIARSIERILGRDCHDPN